MPPKVRISVPSHEVLQAFRSCRPLDEDFAVSLCPALMEVCKMIGETQGLGWEWPCLALICCAPGLSPRDVMDLAPSIPVRAVVWGCLCHPGATNSSGVIRIFGKAIGRVLKRMQAHETIVGQLQGNGNHYEAEERQLLAGGGSVAACGLQMSSERNRSAALSIEPEINVFFVVDPARNDSRCSSGWEVVGWCYLAPTCHEWIQCIHSTGLFLQYVQCRPRAGSI